MPKHPPNQRRILTANGVVTLPPPPTHRKEPTLITPPDELTVKASNDMNVLEIESRPAPLTKRCEQCKRILPISAFNPHPLGKDGYGRFCAGCRDKIAKQRRTNATITPLPPNQLSTPTQNLTVQPTTRGLESNEPQTKSDELIAAEWLTQTLHALPLEPQRQCLIRLLLSL